jgi:hypothetical protein
MTTSEIRLAIKLAESWYVSNPIDVVSEFDESKGQIAVLALDAIGASRIALRTQVTNGGPDGKRQLVLLRVAGIGATGKPSVTDALVLSDVEEMKKTGRRVFTAETTFKDGAVTAVVKEGGPLYKGSLTYPVTGQVPIELP